MPQTIRSNATASASAASPSEVTPAVGDFVIHLSASTTPMALVKPSEPELARFTFFVSRRREEGRERFRLHMGYFATREQAEPWLAVVRELYPAAWVGEAPGRKLAQRETKSEAKPAAPASVPVAPVAPAAVAAPAAVPAPVRPATVAATPAAPVVAAPAARAARQPPAQFVDDAPTLLMPRQKIAAPPSVAEPALAQPLDEMRRALSSLDGPAAPVPAATPAAASAPQRPAPPPPPAPSQVAAAKPAVARTPAPKPAAPKPAASKPAPPKPAAPKPAESELSDSQVLRILDTRGASDAQGAGMPASSAIREITLLSPDDTSTLRQIRSQVTRNAPVNFAVQLEWSVKPIDLEHVPRLAIFNAYTLYKIEGSRGGRKWFGLRLGFFSDAMAAKQVAYYVRSEFASVAVVPVSGDEREQAEKTGPIVLAVADSSGPAATADTGEQITLIDDRPWTPISSESSVATSAAEAAGGAGSAGRSTAKKPAGGGAAGGGSAAGKRASRPRGSEARGLEETLEILGASQLSIDTGKGERLNLSGVQVKRDQRTSTFSRLLDRLTDKLRS